MTCLPVIELSGGPIERGASHGRQLKKRIHATFEFYQQAIFLNSKLDAGEIRARADRVRVLIENFCPDYLVELDALAEAAEIDSWKVLVLNARTEILNAPLAECTSLYFVKTALLGQTWDWIRQLEDLAVVLRYEMQDGHVITTLSEPGMLAKIGMNSAGLGVCLNFLVSESRLDGVPVHIMLRAILECRDVETARERLLSSGEGKSSHFLIADHKGNCCGFEFAANRHAELRAERGVYVHSNHCIARSMESVMVPTSAERLTKAQSCLQHIDACRLEDMQDILLDDSMGETSIQASYHPEEVLNGLEVGTCATIIMDLPARQFYFRKGPGTSRDFSFIAC